MAARDPDDKKTRLLDAAFAEFAANGIAATRTDAIAERAGRSAGLIYAYFGSEDGLFDAVFERIVADKVAQVPFTPEDLPGYAARLFDSHAAHPEVARVVAWNQLERRGPAVRDVGSDESGRRKIEQVREAQCRGVLPGHFDAAQVVYLTQSVALSWFFLPDEITAHAADPADLDRRRATVVEAVRRLMGS
ncbi:TetR/AcrR family transcriptional regulator [Nonomuraea endophytica]|uniref:AcrR family transcriptional regulator n=1 Tax=Nonomuraea endophytica TaxID=714136 RepID=A0A7W8A8Z2_9ACTN|nr:TetR family transcriptional regulator [Nonomuraea endophytica]MBB5081765.1 AcrR family transcriptional regulator [Nonomuraea endophytica]